MIGLKYLQLFTWDLTKELLDKILSDYNFDNLEIIETKNKRN